MKRGDVVIVAVQGDYGKPRPALVIQSDLFLDTASVVILPITSTRVDAPLLRIELPATAETGLRVASDVMLDKVLTVRRDRIGQVIGTAPDEIVQSAARNLSVFLGIA